MRTTNQALITTQCSGVPSQPPPHPSMMGQGAATAQMLVNNPMISVAAQQYGQDLASRGQAMLDSNVRIRII